MSNKLQKVLSEIDKVKEKIAVQQTRLRELEQQKTELENMEIVGMVRGLDVAPEELAAFIKAFRGSKAGTPDFMESEDNEHEESEHEAEKAADRNGLHDALHLPFDDAPFGHGCGAGRIGQRCARLHL